MSSLECEVKWGFVSGFEGLQKDSPRCGVVLGFGVEVGKMFECLFDGWSKMAGGQAGQGSRKQVDAVFWTGAGAGGKRGGLAGTGSSCVLQVPRYPGYA